MCVRLFITNEIKMEIIFTTDCYRKFIIVIDRGEPTRLSKREKFPSTQIHQTAHGICIQNVVFDINVDNHQMRLLIVLIGATQLED